MNPRHRDRVIAKFPNALILAAAWCFVGALLMWPDRELPRHSHLVDNVWPEFVYGVIFFMLGVLVLLGFLGFFPDVVRKPIYLIGGIVTAGVATALATDGSWLSAGLLGIFAGLSLDTYWRYPRRHEDSTPRAAAAERERAA